MRRHFGTVATPGLHCVDVSSARSGGVLSSQRLPFQQYTVCGTHDEYLVRDTMEVLNCDVPVVLVAVQKVRLWKSRSRRAKTD